ncbi:MAG: phospholipid carrier-dependent glycosyltransferase [Acidobacteriota bacterium]
MLRAWLLVVLIALAIHLGGYPLYDADEGRNGEVGREMAASNDYVMPRLDGLPYLDKPIAYFAAEAAAMEVLGPTEVAARLPAYLCTLLTAALLAWFARRIGADPLIAAIAYLSMPLTLAFSRTVIFDSMLSLFIAGAIVAFYCACHPGGDGGEDAATGRGSSGVATIVAWAAMGMGVITKGPVAILIPLIIAVPYAISRKRARRLFSIAALVVFGVVVAPWVWAISRAVPDFLHYVLVTETMQRLATKALKRTGPPWYFIPYLLGGAMPWSVVAIALWRRARAGFRDNATLYLLLWIAIPFVFFSLSQSKRPQYILPVMPAVALLVARLLGARENEISSSHADKTLNLEKAGAGRLWPGSTAFRIAGIVLVVLGIALLLAPWLAPAKAMHDDLMKSAAPTALALGASALVAGLVTCFSRRRDLAVMALSLPVIVLPLAANPLMVAIGVRRSAQSLAGQIRPHLHPSTEVVGIEAYTGSMSFYLRRPVTVVTPDAEEFTSNYLIRHYGVYADDPTSTIRRLELVERLVSDTATPRVFLVRERDRLHRALVELHGGRLIATGAHFVAYESSNNGQPPRVR